MRLPVNCALPLAALIVLAGCTGHGGSAVSTEPLSSTGPAADYPVVIGAPYAVDGVTYTPSDAMNSDAVGYAAVGAEGGGAISIAHKTLPLPSYAEVTSLATGKTILVRVERRGPMVNDRAIELSPGAAAQLGVSDNSRAPIRIRRVNPPEAERALLRRGERAPDRMDTPQSLLTVLRRKLDPSLAAPALPEPALLPVAPAPALPTPKPALAAVRAPTAKSAPPIAARPIPVAKPAALATRPVSVEKSSLTATASRAPRPTEGGQFFVQIGSYSNRQNADAAARKVGGSVRPADRIARVVMGPYATRTQADAALAKARSAGYRDAQVQTAR